MEELAEQRGSLFDTACDNLWNGRWKIPPQCNLFSVYVSWKLLIMNISVFFKEKNTTLHLFFVTHNSILGVWETYEGIRNIDVNSADQEDQCKHAGKSVFKNIYLHATDQGSGCQRGTWINFSSHWSSQSFC